MIVEFAIVLTLGFGPPDAGWSLGIDPRAVVQIESRVLPGGVNVEDACGIAYGPLGFASSDPRCSSASEKPIPQHEMEHTGQFSAIGPLLLLLVAAAPHTVEDYVGPPDSTWYPTREERDACPLLQFSGESRDRLDRLRVLPCWDLFGIEVPWYVHGDRLMAY